MLNKNDDIILDIESLSNDGNGVGKSDGMAVFVPYTCVGDKITAHIVKNKKTYAFAKVLKIEKPSSDRIENDCSAFGKCGGCAFRHMKYTSELEAKKKFADDAIERIAKMNFKTEKIISATENHYRNKAQYPVRNENGKIVAGFFANHSHRVVPSDNCMLQPKEFEEIKNLILEFVQKNNIYVYDELSGKGLLRHIYIRKAFKTGEIMVCLVICGNNFPNVAELVNELKKQNNNISSVILNINKQKTNVVLGKKCFTVFGNGYITDELLGKKFRISPLSFYQVNHEATEKLYSIVKDFAQLGDGETLIDLFCGIGTIGLCVSGEKNRLIGIEIVPQAVENAKENAKLNGVKNAEFICASSAEASEMLKNKGVSADVVVVDPPRKGCERETIENIKSFGAKRVVYVSCNPASLARDLVIFAENGYTPVKATAVDLFPRTTHVETVVLLRKV